MPNILSLTDIASYLPDVDTSAYSQATLSGIVSMATTRMAQYCNVTGFDFTVQTDTDRTRINNQGELIFLAHRRPIVTVSGISLVKGQFSTTLLLSASDGTIYYDLPTPSNYLTYSNRYLTGTGTMLVGGSSNLVTVAGADTYTKVTYYGGFQVVPDDLKLACALMVRDLLAIPLNPLGAEQIQQGNYNVRFDQRGMGTRKLGSQGSRLAQMAYELLDQGGYVRRAV